MYADSEMSIFNRENLRNSAFQRGKTFFIDPLKKKKKRTKKQQGSLYPVAKLNHVKIFLTFLRVTTKLPKRFHVHAKIRAIQFHVALVGRRTAEI